jgi:hypothetical protein
MSAVAFALPSGIITPPAITASAREGDAVARLSLDRPDSVSVDKVRANRLATLIRVCAAAAEMGWDGFRAQPISVATYKRAKEFLDAIPLTARDPEISAHPDGDVEFEWFRSTGCVLTISVGRDVIHYAALVSGQPPISGRNVFAGTIQAPIAELLAKVAFPPR